MNLGIAPTGEAWLGLGYGPDDVFGDPVGMAGRVAGDVLGDPVGMLGLIYASFVGVGASIATATEITGKLYGLRPFGYWPKFKDNPVPGTRKTIWTHGGSEGPGLSFLVKWLEDRNAASDFQNQLALIDAADNIRFYHRDSLWYMHIHAAGTTPYFDDMRSDRWGHEVKLWLKDPYMYSEIHQSWTVVAGTLPQSSDSMNNYGHVADGFEALAITGHYSSPNHVEDLVLSVADGDSMTLSDRLLSDEEITLEVDGALSTEWESDLTSLATFQQDASTSGASFSVDHIAIAAGGYAIVDLAGPWPTKKPVKMTANLTITGTASVQISNDGGATYSEAVTAANIESGESAIYYLTGSAKIADMKVKFNCPLGSTMLIHALKIERELDCSGADLPVVQPGEEKAFTVSCNVTKSTSATIAGTYHPRRYAI
jgi:hypothetical protein